MDDLIRLIKAIAKEGADLAGIEKALQEYNPVDAITTKEEAWGFIKANDILLNTLDQKVGERVKTAEENIMGGKFQDAMKAEKERIIAELQPDETPEQKRIRELEDRLAKGESEKLTTKLQDELSTKAKELGVDPIEARRLAVLGDDAMGFLESQAESRKAAIEAARNEVIKGKYNGEGPKKPVDVNTLSTLSDNDLNAAAMNNPAMKQAVLEEVRRRTRPVK